MSYPLSRTALHSAHIEPGAVPFAGDAMPAQYPPAILKEPLPLRDREGPFGVSPIDPLNRC